MEPPPKWLAMSHTGRPVPLRTNEECKPGLYHFYDARTLPLMTGNPADLPPALHATSARLVMKDDQGGWVRLKIPVLSADMALQMLGLWQATPREDCWERSGLRVVDLPWVNEVNEVNYLPLSFNFQGKAARVRVSYWPPLVRLYKARSAGRRTRKHWDSLWASAAHLAAWGRHLTRGGEYPRLGWQPYPWSSAVNRGSKAALVRHLCSNGRCFNPDHVTPGVARSNLMDRYNARRVGEEGEIVGGKLSDEQIEVLKTCELDSEAKEYFKTRFNVPL